MKFKEIILKVLKRERKTKKKEIFLEF